MKRQKYFNMLLFYLKQLPQEEAYRTVTFFSEIVEDKIEAGISEDDALNQYGDAKDFAAKLLKDCYNIEPVFEEYVEEDNEPQIIDENQDVYTVDADEVNEINVTVKGMDIDILPSADERIHVCYIEKEGFTNDIKTENSKLIVTFNKTTNDGILGGILKGKNKDNLPNITIEVPSTYTSNLMLNNENGTTRVTNIANSNNLWCNSKNGHIRVINSNANSLIAKTTNFRITITGATIAKELDTTTSKGSIDINEVSAESVICKTSDSDISLKKVTSKNMIQAATSNSYIEFKQISSNTIDLKTSNGRISGTIAGSIDDYAITSKTNGKSNLPNIPFGVKKLSATTTKDNIYITFQEPSK